jgi:hypothetical protein
MLNRGPRHPGAAVIGDLDPDHAVPGLHHDHDRLPAKTRGCPGPSTPLTNARATRACSARPASVALSRTAALVISHPPFAARTPRKPPGLSDTRGCTLDSAPRGKPGHATSAAHPWPSAAACGKPAVTPTVPERGEAAVEPLAHPADRLDRIDRIRLADQRKNYQRPNQAVLTPAHDGHGIPEAINSPGRPAGARSFLRAHSPGITERSPAGGHHHRVCRMATR